MEIKDQIRIRMEELDMPVTELAKRAEVSTQSVRFWLNGRSFPGKNKLPLVERALSCKLNFSGAESEKSVTVEDALRETDIATFLAISKLPPQLKLLFSKLAQEIVAHSAPSMPETPLANTRGYAIKRKPVR